MGGGEDRGQRLKCNLKMIMYKSMIFLYRNMATSKVIPISHYLERTSGK